MEYNFTNTVDIVYKIILAIVAVLTFIYSKAAQKSIVTLKRTKKKIFSESTFNMLKQIIGLFVVLMFFAWNILDLRATLKKELPLSFPLVFNVAISFFIMLMSLWSAILFITVIFKREKENIKSKKT